MSRYLPRRLRHLAQAPSLAEAVAAVQAALLGGAS